MPLHALKPANSVEITVVAPMHNEALCVEEFCTRVDAVLRQISDSYEIVVVNDGSTDETGTLLDEFAAANPHLRHVRLGRQSGQWAAIYAGFQQSRGAYVVMMDGDLQHLPEDIPLLLNEIRKGYDLVSGRRARRVDNFWLRRVPSVLANWLLRATTGCTVRDMGGFKCLRGEIARDLRLRAGFHRLLPALVHLMGGSVSEVATTNGQRFAGQSHYGLGRSIDVLFDIVLLGFQSSCKSRPVYLFGRVSLLLSMLGIAVMSWLLFDKFAHGVDMGSRPPFIATVVIFLSSLGFMSLGFVLEFLSDLLNAVTHRKPYRIASITQHESAESPAVSLPLIDHRAA